MKRLVLSLLLIMVLAAAAGAETREFRWFKIDVPGGWSVHEVEGGAVVFISPQKDASFSLLYEPADGKDPEALAKQHAAALKGSAPANDGEGMYTFTVRSDDGIETICLCSVDKGMFKMLTLTDPGRRYSDTIGTSITSIVEKK